MRSYIPKQEKRVRERIEAKLDAQLVQELERYCQYLDSDRDYVLAQALEIAFQKDRGFNNWLAPQPADPVATAATASADGPSPRIRRARQKRETIPQASPAVAEIPATRTTRPAEERP